MRYTASTILLILLLCLSGALHGQSVGELEAQRKRAQERIVQSERLLKESSAQQLSRMEKVRLLESQIAERNLLIEDMERQIQAARMAISQGREQVDSLGVRLERVKDEYARFLRSVQFRMRGQSVLLYVLSSRDLNTMYRRMRFYREYLTHQQANYARIDSLRGEISRGVETLRTRQSQLEKSEKALKATRAEFEESRSSLSQEIEKLKQQDKSLEAEIAKEQKLAAQLSQRIDRLMRQEAAAARKKPSTKAQRAHSAGFAAAKGKLPWPVENAMVVRGYGAQKSLLFKDVKTNSTGVDLAVKGNQAVRPLYEGKVSKIAEMPGGNIVVIIRHGDYLTLYSNLVQVSVRVDQNVTRETKLGYIYQRRGESTRVLHLEIWKGFESQNPMLWLGR